MHALKRWTAAFTSIIGSDISSEPIAPGFSSLGEFPLSLDLPPPAAPAYLLASARFFSAASRFSTRQA